VQIPEQSSADSERSSIICGGWGRRDEKRRKKMKKDEKKRVYFCFFVFLKISWWGRCPEQVGAPGTVSKSGELLGRGSDRGDRREVVEDRNILQAPLFTADELDDFFI